MDNLRSLDDKRIINNFIIQFYRIKLGAAGLVHIVAFVSICVHSQSLQYVNK